MTDGDEECVAMFISNAKWTDRSCGQLHPAVCEKPSEINIIKINLKNILKILHVLLHLCSEFYFIFTSDPSKEKSKPVTQHQVTEGTLLSTSYFE